MKTAAEPPAGYGYGHMEGQEKVHLVKIEVYNAISICGAYLRSESIIDESYGIERNVCSKCLKIRKQQGF